LPFSGYTILEGDTGLIRPNFIPVSGSKDSKISNFSLIRRHGDTFPE